jgi:hypothetical protein
VGMPSSTPLSLRPVLFSLPLGLRQT